MEQIKLNTIPSGVPSVCHISQFDNTSRIIRCHLFNGSDPLALTGSETIKLFMRKSNNSRAEFEIESTSGAFIDLVITSEMSDIAGDSECKFQITDSEKTIGTLNFKMVVEPDAYGDSLKTRSVSGPIATFETDLTEDLIKLDVDLEPIQDLHGYDYPWTAGGGDNVMLLSPNNKSDTVFGVTYSYDAETGKITLSGTNNNTTAHGLVGFKPLEDGLITPNFQVGETYTLSVYLPLNTMYCQFTYKNTNNITRPMGYKRGTGSFSSITFTVPDDFVELIQFIIYVDGTATTLSGEIYFELVKGSTAPTSYTPYSNICPISGHDSAQLFRTGKNLLSPTLYKGLNYNPTVGTTVTLTESPKQLTDNHDGTFSISTTANWETFCMIVPIKSTTYYRKTVISSNGALGTTEVWLDKNLKVISTYNNTDTTQTKNGLLTIPDNASYFAWVITNRAVANSTLTIMQPQLELGSTATDYEPYESDPTPITVQFGQTIYKGKLYSEQRKVLVTHVGMDLGYFTWNHYVTETRNYFYSNQPPPIPPKGTTSPEVNNDISSIYSCEKYADVVNGYTYSWIHSGFTLPATTKRLYIYDEAMENEDAAAFKTRVTGQQFVYEVAEPFFIDLTQIQTASIDSTPVASFETTLAMPLNTSEHSFSCFQAEGTPTPENPIPIIGVSEITAYRTEKNLTNITISATNHWGTDTQELVSFLNTLPIGVYTISNKYRINELPGNNKVQHGRFYITALVDGSQTPVLPYSVVTDTSPAIGKIYQESGTFEITASNKGKFNHAYRYCDQDTTHTGSDRGSYICYDIQLELGSTATSYEPYNGESVTVSLGGTYYGGKLVQQEDGSRKIVLSHAQLVLSSANANIINRVNANKYRVFNADCGAKVTGSDYADIKCNKMSNQTGTANDNRCYINSSGDIRMNFTSEYDTVADMIAAIESIAIVYPLETPIEIDLPDGDPLTTLVGENNVYCNTGDTALTYYYNMVADPIRIPALVGTNNVYSDAGDVDVEYYTTLEGGND